MKTRLFFILLVTNSFLFAQSTTTISAGVKMVKNESKSVIFAYVDESPSMDNIATEVEQKGKMAFHVNARMHQLSEASDMHFFLEGQGYLGSINGLAANVGLFYDSQESSNVKFRPEIGAVLGYNSTPIGTMENNDVYIQVNDTKFKDYTDVDVALRNIYYGLKPGVNVFFGSDGDTGFGIGVHYQLSLKSGYVAFKGEDQNGENVVETEKLSENNVGFYVDGKSTDKVPFNADGLEFRIFYQF
jgi:hypothetical protein